METSQVRVDLGARPARRDEVPLSLQLFVGGDDRAAGHPELGGQGPGTWQMVPRASTPSMMRPRTPSQIRTGSGRES